MQHFLKHILKHQSVSAALNDDKTKTVEADVKLPDAVLQDAAEVVEVAAETAAAVVTDSDTTAQVVRKAAATTAAVVVTIAAEKLAEIAATIAAAAKAAATSVVAGGDAAAQVVQTAAAKAAAVVANASTIAAAKLAEAQAAGQTDPTTVAEAAAIAAARVAEATNAAAETVVADGDAAAQVVRTAAAEAAAIILAATAEVSTKVAAIFATEQDQLVEHLQQAERLSAVGQLAGGIAHDFNNLLTTINGYTEFVLMTLDKSDARREDLIEVSKAGLRAVTLTRQLLAFSRQQVLQPRVLDVNALITGIQALLRRTMSEDIEVVMALGDVAPVRVDAGQFDQMLLNLALNARDAMPDGGQLHFVTDSVDVDEAFTRQHPLMTPARYTRLTVSDTGVGMTRETQARIFEPFFTTKPVGKGTGLGLATVYGIVKQSGGFVWVESHVGRGTSFTVYLPVVNAPLEPTPSARASELTVGGAETILLVEDDGAVRRLATHSLSYRGYHVLDARDGEHGLAVAHQYQGPIHLLLTDVVMPGLCGPDLASRLLPTRPEMRVLYSSGYTDGAYIAALRDAPLLAKPYLPNDLLRRVRDVLDATSTP
jgi:signal transduction histidine kinase